jgi:hypothetical protein
VSKSEVLRGDVVTKIAEHGPSDDMRLDLVLASLLHVVVELIADEIHVDDAFQF